MRKVVWVVLLGLGACTQSQSPPPAAISVTAPAPTPTVNEADRRACGVAYYFAITYAATVTPDRKPRHWPDNTWLPFANDFGDAAYTEGTSPQLRTALRWVDTAVIKWRRGDNTRLNRAIDELNRLCLRQ